MASCKINGTLSITSQNITNHNASKNMGNDIQVQFVVNWFMDIDTCSPLPEQITCMSTYVCMPNSANLQRTISMSVK
jgi:hypothetical protein